MAYGDLTRQVKQVCILFIKTNGCFPKTDDVLASLPHLKARKAGVYKAVQTLRGKYEAGVLTQDIEAPLVDVPKFDDSWAGMAKRVSFYLEQLDGMVHRSGGMQIPVKEIVELAKLKREIERWIKEEEGDKGAVAASRASMSQVTMRS